MLAKRNRHLALDRYRDLQLSSRLASANRHELVSILYEQLDAALGAAAVAYEQGRNPVITIQMGRARSILTALESGLDFAQGGDLARTLAMVYRSMQSRLSDVTEYPAAIEEVRAGLADMARSWAALSSR
jgi:flagellar secretion chaperone FliS